MLFREHLRAGGAEHSALAISQPAHAWISGQLLRAWVAPLEEPLLLAATLHDVGWLDWETAPSFDPSTGRPHLFRDVGAATHAPMWEGGVERALTAWGTRVALLISRHGSLIYGRYVDRHRISDADAAAVDQYLRTQEPLQAAWTRALGLGQATVEHDSGLVAFADTLSLALCGELRTPLDVEAPDPAGNAQRFRLAARGDEAAEFTLAPWPFRGDALTVTCEARPMRGGRFRDEAAMRAWLASPERVTFQAQLTPG